MRFFLKMLLSFLLGCALAVLVMRPAGESPQRIREAVPSDKVVDVG